VRIYDQSSPCSNGSMRGLDERRPGTLESSGWQNRVWVKVHPLRDAGWATGLSHRCISDEAMTPLSVKAGNTGIELGQDG
jgi:hypothetical protein